MLRFIVDSRVEFVDNNISYRLSFKSYYSLKRLLAKGASSAPISAFQLIANIDIVCEIAVAHTIATDFQYLLLAYRIPQGFKPVNFSM